MRTLICIDDTDNIDSRGTGDIASEIAEEIELRCWGACSYISRHQLFVHPDFPYTSHNSSMCFSADVAPEQLDEVIGFAGSYLMRESAVGSDPGLCVAVVDDIRSHEELTDFGHRAKQSVISMEEAYGLANRLGDDRRGRDGYQWCSAALHPADLPDGKYHFQ